MNMLRTIRDRYWFAKYSIVHARSLAHQEAWQEKCLRTLLTRAYDTVPFWKTIFDEAGIDPASIRSHADLVRLPVTNKHTFIGRMIEEYIDRTEPARSIWYVTSGTSGTPFRFLMSNHTMRGSVNDFASLRFLWWRGYSPHRLATTKLVRIKMRAPENKYRMFVPVGTYLADPRAALQRISAFAPEVLSAYPSILMDMANVIESGAVSNPRPPYVLSFGEMLSPAVRTRIASIFGSEIYDRYGLEEIGVVGLECQAHEGFHVHTESVIVEVTDGAYRPIATGEEGHVVVTDLFNFNMPFIRYDTGDVGTITYDSCACGLRSPRLRIRGRYTAFLDFPLRRIHHLEFDAAMDGFMNDVLQYQIAKISDGDILVRVVPGPSFGRPVVASIERNLRALAGTHMRVRVEAVAEIPITPSGKSRIVVNESRDIS